MGRGRAWIGLLAADAFTALTAVAGGVLLATGHEDERFPIQALHRTPFPDYVIPGCLLGSVVGGSAAVAAVATVRGPSAGGRASVVAGATLLGWIVGGELLLDLPRGTVTDRVTDAVYLATGALMVGLGVVVQRGPGGRAR